MADWTGERPAGTSGSGRGVPRSVEEARRELAATRRRITSDLDGIGARLRGTAEDIRGRLDLLEPARERIRGEIWTSLALAFGAGLAYAVLTAPRRGGGRRPLGRVLRSAARQLPGAVLSGVRSGVAERLRHDWNDRRALPAGT